MTVRVHTLNRCLTHACPMACATIDTTHRILLFFFAYKDASSILTQVVVLRCQLVQSARILDVKQSACPYYCVCSSFAIWICLLRRCMQDVPVSCPTVCSTAVLQSSMMGWSLLCGCGCAGFARFMLLTRLPVCIAPATGTGHAVSRGPVTSMSFCAKKVVPKASIDGQVQ